MLAALPLPLVAKGFLLATLEPIGAGTPNCNEVSKLTSEYEFVSPLPPYVEHD